MFLFIASVFYTALLLYGVGGRVTEGIDDVASIQQMYGVINNTPYEQLQINTILIATTIGVSFMNIALGGIFMKTKSPIYWGFFFTIIVVGFLNCIATAMSGTNPFTNFFMICCGIMAYFAFVLELTYKEFCVLGNIYLQATICLLSAMAPLMLSIRKWVNGNLSVFKLCLVTINAIAHSILYIFVCKHFDAADVDFATFRNDTMHDLKRTVRKFGMPKGHRKGAYGTELLGYFEARMLIYLPTYKWVLDNVPEVHHVAERIKEQSKIQDIVFLDYNTNIDFRDVSKPLSHAGLVKLYIEGNYPEGLDGYLPMTNEEQEQKKQLDKESRKEIKNRANKKKFEQSGSLFDNE